MPGTGHSIRDLRLVVAAGKFTTQIEHQISRNKEDIIIEQDVSFSYWIVCIHPDKSEVENKKNSAGTASFLHEILGRIESCDLLEFLEYNLIFQDSFDNVWPLAGGAVEKAEQEASRRRAWQIEIQE